MKKRICLIGANSLLGSKILEKNKIFDIQSTINNIINYNKINEVIKLDITNKENCTIISKLKPDIIINTAAITDLDFCEKNQVLAKNVNIKGVENLVEISKQIGCKMIHISTDGIFHGKDQKYVEDDTPNPINYYGKTKLESEKIVSKLDDFLIFRTSVLYGFLSKDMLETRSKYSKSMNFGLWVVDKLHQSKNIQIVNDQFSNPTLADNLVEIIFQSIEKNLIGIYHATDIGCVSRFDFVQRIAKKFNYNLDFIQETSSKKLNQFAKRSSKTCLDCSKISNEGIKIYNLDYSLEKFYQQVKNEDASLISKSNNR